MSWASIVRANSPPVATPPITPSAAAGASSVAAAAAAPSALLANNNGSKTAPGKRSNEASRSPPSTQPQQQASAPMNQQSQFKLTPVMAAQKSGATSFAPAPLALAPGTTLPVLAAADAAGGKNNNNNNNNNSNSGKKRNSPKSNNKNSPIAIAARYVQRYARDELLSLRAAGSTGRYLIAAVDHISQVELSDVARGTMDIVSTAARNGADVALSHLRREQEQEEKYSADCAQCLALDIDQSLPTAALVKAPPAGSCAQITELIKNSLKTNRSRITFMAQSPHVVFGQLRLAIALGEGSQQLHELLVQRIKQQQQQQQQAHKNNNNGGTKKISPDRVMTPPIAATTAAVAAVPPLRDSALKKMPSKCIDKIRAYLCGAGFHMAPPKSSDDQVYSYINQTLKFDLILNNETPLFSESSRAKAHSSPFERFLHVMFWRDEDKEKTAKRNAMIQHWQMPVLVAMLTGDVDAAVLLMHLNFEVLDDQFLWQLPFLQALEATEKIKAHVLRHLARYFFKKQTERAYFTSLTMRK